MAKRKTPGQPPLGIGKDRAVFLRVNVHQWQLEQLEDDCNKMFPEGMKVSVLVRALFKYFFNLPPGERLKIYMGTRK